MTPTGYFMLKNHFDKLFEGGYPNNDLEHIRDVYKYAFGQKVHLYDIYTSSIKVPTNPIKKIITFVGPENNELKFGVMPCVRDNEICHVSVFSNNYLGGIDEDNVNDYINEVYLAMRQISEADSFGKSTDLEARYSPYHAFIKMCPFYFTYHHVISHYPKAHNAIEFMNILEKYFCDSESAIKVMESLASTRYKSDFEEIYSTMTANNTVELFF